MQGWNGNKRQRTIPPQHSRPLPWTAIADGEQTVETDWCSRMEIDCRRLIMMRPSSLHPTESCVKLESIPEFLKSDQNFRNFDNAQQIHWKVDNSSASHFTSDIRAYGSWTPWRAVKKVFRNARTSSWRRAIAPLNSWDGPAKKSWKKLNQAGSFGTTSRWNTKTHYFEKNIWAEVQTLMQIHGKNYYALPTKGDLAKHLFSKTVFVNKTFAVEFQICGEPWLVERDVPDAKIGQLLQTRRFPRWMTNPHQ